MTRTALLTTSLLLLDLGACVFPDKQVGDDEGNADSDTSLGETDMDSEVDTGEDSEGSSDECEGPFASPILDQDCDGVGLACDNAQDHLNPDQLDQDGDQFGDVADLCPLTASPSNAGDSDRDGVGNDCDLCPAPTELYNDVFGPEVPSWMRVRNVPSHADLDQDGVGDVCDNCVSVPNCQDFGPDNPAPLGANAGSGPDCQLDEDLDGIGDACEGELAVPPSAAGPIGTASGDDLDQDGVVNLEDACPRQPVVSTICTVDADCPAGASCASTAATDGERRCDHVDSDADHVGDVCDTCPVTANPEQVIDGGQQIDDQDGDFIGAVCETHPECDLAEDPHPIGFYDVAVEGMCCVTTYPGDDVLHDPDGAPIRLDCTAEQEDAGICRGLPAAMSVRPGVITLPIGCAAALADAGVEAATPLTLADVGGDVEALWGKACMLPPFDQDFDGIGDACDLCRFGFDPDNLPYIDDEGAVWLEFGKACSGDYASDLIPGAACEWP
ncbi:thrombospondin type 3 repeat-containing protein [Nannocystaceae bacterium ST9]